MFIKKMAAWTRNLRRNRRRTTVAKSYTRLCTLLDLEDRRMLASILGTAEAFAVLAGSAVTNTGATSITGDVGIWPGTSITGFGTVAHTGTVHNTDPVAMQAEADNATAYNGLAAMPLNTNLTGQNLGGLTLASGVYHFNSTAQLTGTLTLDAQGNNNAYWVFQVESGLTTAINSSVLVVNAGSNGGSDDGIFWQVGSSATLGSAAAFKGNILALASITLGTAATISNGRTLAQSGNVTMQSNTIVNVGPNGGSGYTGGLEFVNGRVVPINHAPVLNAAKSPALTASNVNSGYAFGAVGTLVSKLVDFPTPSGQVDNVTDVDRGAVLGIAVTLAPQDHGVGYFSTDNGAHWTFIGVLGPRATRLLAADTMTRIYFKPDAGFSGLVSNAFNFRAWDRTTGTNGGLVNSTVNGGRTSLSTVEDTITINVIRNSAPTLDSNKSPVLNSVAHDSGNPVGAVGTLVSMLVDFAGPLHNVSDIDAGAKLGIAVTALDTAHGMWFYSRNNGATWLATGAVSNTLARCLAADTATRVYFKPNAGYQGLLATAITFRAWDRTFGSNGDVLTTIDNGGITTFSSGTDTASLSVT